MIASGRDYTLQRDFTWVGHYYAGMSATTTSSSAIVGGYYRFAAFGNDHFEIGPTIGIGYLKLDARIEAAGTLDGPSGPESQTRDESASSHQPHRSRGWLRRGLSGSAGSSCAATTCTSRRRRGTRTLGSSTGAWADYFFVRNAGLAVQYKFNRYSYDPGTEANKLSGQVTFQGVQVFVVVPLLTWARPAPRRYASGRLGERSIDVLILLTLVRMMRAFGHALKDAEFRALLLVLVAQLVAVRSSTQRSKVGKSSIRSTSA